MEIPKMKVFIYLLTFVCYSYSGYGSTVLANLREAVLTAENLFGDVLEKVTDVIRVMGSVKKVVDDTIQEECIWSCPGGVKPKPNKYFKVRPNGCGPEGLEVDTTFLSPIEMTKCCNDHDICYGTCGKLKDKCDDDFKRCLYRICEKNILSDLEVTACKAAAKAFYTACNIVGCPFYKDAQHAACYCPISKEKYIEL